MFKIEVDTHSLSTASEIKVHIIDHTNIWIIYGSYTMIYNNKIYKYTHI